MTPSNITTSAAGAGKISASGAGEAKTNLDEPLLVLAGFASGAALGMVAEAGEWGDSKAESGLVLGFFAIN